MVSKRGRGQEIQRASSLCDVEEQFLELLGLPGAKENIAKHYDISMKLYEQMLGPTMMCFGCKC